MRWQLAADRARVPWPTVVAWMDSGQLEDVVDGFDRLVSQADVDALKAAAPTELPGVTVTDDGLHRIVPGSLRVDRDRQTTVADGD